MQSVIRLPRTGGFTLLELMVVLLLLGLVYGLAAPSIGAASPYTNPSSSNTTINSSRVKPPVRGSLITLCIRTGEPPQRHSQLTTSLASPSPPSLPSLPRETMSKAPCVPGATY